MLFKGAVVKDNVIEVNKARFEGKVMEYFGHGKGKGYGGIFMPKGHYHIGKVSLMSDKCTLNCP